MLMNVRFETPEMLSFDPAFCWHLATASKYFKSSLVPWMGFKV